MSCKFHKPWGAQLVYETRHGRSSAIRNCGPMKHETGRVTADT